MNNLQSDLRGSGNIGMDWGFFFRLEIDPESVN